MTSTFDCNLETSSEFTKAKLLKPAYSQVFSQTEIDRQWSIIKIQRSWAWPKANMRPLLVTVVLSHKFCRNALSRLSFVK